MTEFALNAVVGHPIAHSLSPDMFRAAYRQDGRGADYLRLACDTAGEAISLFKRLGLSGMSVTSPFKESILEYLDELDVSAERLDAVNTVVFGEHGLKGYNTDVAGVIGAFQSGGIDLSGKSVMVLGAGGAAKAAAYALCQVPGAEVTIINRTMQRAREIAEKLGCRHLPIGELGHSLEASEAVVSCLPKGVNLLSGEVLDPRLVLMDANYGPSELKRQAEEAGCLCVDGSLWLLHQALSAYKLFTGDEAPASSMASALADGVDRFETVKSNIALIGFMGSGKSSIGRLLAENLGRTFVDTDEMIENMAGRSIDQIFEQDGEIIFRRMEAETIEGVCEQSKAVISLGGGAILDEGNVDRIRRCCRVVWLWADPRCIFERLNGDNRRPLLKVANPLERIEDLLEGRMDKYAKACDMLLDTSSRDLQECSERIADEMG